MVGRGSLSRSISIRLIPPYGLLIFVEIERGREPRPYAVSIRLIRQRLMGEVTSTPTVGVGNRNSLLQGSRALQGISIRIYYRARYPLA